MVRASQASLGSSGVCVSERLSKDAKLAAAALAQSLFSRPKGRGPARGRRRRAMAVEALVPPDAACVATVYTNAPERRREAVFADLCTLFVPRLSTTAHLTERHTLHSPLDRGETKKRILLQRLTKNRSLVSPGVVECAFPSRRGAREVWGNPPPACGAGCAGVRGSRFGVWPHGKAHSADDATTTVYTNAPKRLRGAVFADLCTLFVPTAARATG